MKKYLSGLWLVFVALVIIGAIYGTLNLVNLRNQNKDLEDKYRLLSEKVQTLDDNTQTKFGSLQKGIDDNKNQLSDLLNQNKTYQVQLASQKNQIAALEKQIDLSKMVLGATTSVSTPAPASSSSIKTADVKTSAKETTTSTYININNQRQATIIIERVGTYKIDISDNETALSLLQKAAKLKGFSYKTDPKFPTDPFITEIGGIAQQNNGNSGTYWALYKNGAYSNASAKNTPVNKNDTITWKLESWSF